VQIGPYSLQGTLIVAPMAGVTDRPFRTLCRAFGAALAVSEMIGSNPRLIGTAKTQRRMDHAGEIAPISVQIAGADPHMLAEAARFNVQHGADIIDINMGCPAKKVCNVAAGSALLRDEGLVARILEAVVAAVPDTPVTLKCRTGWDRDTRNAVRIARIAEGAGIRALALHGRTRADRYMGEAEYETIAEVRAHIAIPLIANGDIDSARKARRVLELTGADAVMIGRAAQGRPWIFAEVAHYLATGQELPAPTLEERRRICHGHVLDIHAFYGPDKGVRIARKHIGWYVQGIPGAHAFRQHMVLLDDRHAQLAAVDHFFRDPEAWLPPDARRDFAEELAA